MIHRFCTFLLAVVMLTGVTACGTERDLPLLSGK